MLEDLQEMLQDLEEYNYIYEMWATKAYSSEPNEKHDEDEYRDEMIGISWLSSDLESWLKKIKYEKLSVEEANIVLDAINKVIDINLHKDFIRSFYYSDEKGINKIQKEWLDPIKKLLEIGGKTKYEILYKEVTNEDKTLLNEIVDENLVNIFKNDYELNEVRILNLYYVLMTITLTGRKKILQSTIKKIEKKIDVDICNARIIGSNNLLEYFFARKYDLSLFKEEGALEELNVKFGFEDFISRYLPKTKFASNPCIDLLFFKTNEKSKFLINSLTLIDTIFSKVEGKIYKYLDTIELARLINEFGWILEIEDYIIKRIFLDSKGKFYINKDILRRNLYVTLSSDDSVIKEAPMIEFKALQMWGRVKGHSNALKKFVKGFKNLEIKDKIEFLMDKDYCGRNLIHYAFIFEDTKMLQIIDDLKRNANHLEVIEINKIIDQLDYFNKYPWEYRNETDENCKLFKKLESSLKNKDDKKWGSYKFLYGPSLLDAIGMLLSNKIGFSKEVVKLTNYDIFTELNEQLKLYKKNDINFDEEDINLKRLLEYTDSINTSKEKSMKRNLKKFLGEEGYKVINVLQRLGYSIVEVKDKSSYILENFKEVTAEGILIDIEELIITSVIGDFSNFLHIDEGKFKLYHEVTENRNSKEELEDSVKKLNFIKYEDIAERMSYLRSEFCNIDLSYSTKLTFHDFPVLRTSDPEGKYRTMSYTSDMELLDRLTEIFYGERVLTLYIKLVDIVKKRNKKETSSEIWNYLGWHKDIRIFYEKKIVFLRKNSILEDKYKYFILGKGFTIEEGFAIEEV